MIRLQKTLDVRDLKMMYELQKKAKLTLVSATSLVEGGAHDVLLKENSSNNYPK